jgi:hypothetical protein
MEVLWIIGLILFAAFAWGFFKSYSGSPITPIGKISGPKKYEVEVVGESKYQQALEKICGGRSEDGAEMYVDAMLVLEDSNRYDNKAVRIDIQGLTVGYLPRESAREYRKQLKEAGHPQLTGVCGAVIRGGWDRGDGDKGHFGVWLDLPAD